MKQHYVPKCYLNEFASSDGKLYTLDFLLFNQGRKPQIRLKTPAQIAYQPDLYTLDMNLPFGYNKLSKEKPYVIEQDIFWRYEKEYPFIIQQIRNRKLIAREQAELFIYALISIKLRNIFILDAEKQKALLKKVVSDNKEDIIEKSMEQFPEMSREQKLAAIKDVEEKIITDDKFVKGANLSALLERETGKRSLIMDVANKLINCEWRILESDYSTLFITSDNPGFCIDSGEGIYNTKFADCTFVFPLTPMLCLIIDDKKRDYQYQFDPREKILHHQLSNQDAITAINDCSTRFCNRYILTQTQQTLNSLLAFLSVRKAS
ncbi:MAG TPA: DUF4238 domain-containing protein [Mucilaginibacter sp.]|jgi:hypothetical protein|nr:DUF4238 domain-containing protein [Mucilaginibacter sp.]